MINKIKKCVVHMPIRKLASIRKCGEVLPIEGADNIELVKIDLWQCVVLKSDHFKKDDLGVYFEIDSFLPTDPRFEFLRTSSFRKNADGSDGFKIRTMEFRKTLSQGLFLPLSTFPEITTTEVGTDVTEILGIKKFDRPISANLTGKAKGDFPFGIHKSDQERLQNLPDYFEKYRDTKFETTEKIDGTSCTIYWNNGEFGVCGHELDFYETEDNSMWVLAIKINIKGILNELKMNIAVQCEFVGNGIQKNKYKINGFRFYLYNIWDIDHFRYMTPEERSCTFCKMKQIAKDNSEFNNNFFHVPILTIDLNPISALNIGYYILRNTMSQLLELVRKDSLVNSQTKMEGFVCKSMDGKVSFKIIDNKHLIKEE